MRGRSSFNGRLACSSAHRWPAPLHGSWSARSAVRPSSADGVVSCAWQQETVLARCRKSIQIGCADVRRSHQILFALNQIDRNGELRPECAQVDQRAHAVACQPDELQEGSVFPSRIGCAVVGRVVLRCEGKPVFRWRSVLRASYLRDAPQDSDVAWVGPLRRADLLRLADRICIAGCAGLAQRPDVAKRQDVLVIDQLRRADIRVEQVRICLGDSDRDSAEPDGPPTRMRWGLPSGCEAWRATSLPSWVSRGMVGGSPSAGLLAACQSGYLKCESFPLKWCAATLAWCVLPFVRRPALP